MAKKIAIIMAIICAAMAVVVVQLRINTDRKAPEISFNDTGITYREGMSNAELLQGVTAYDEAEGDVTDSLTIESVFSVDNKEAVVIYVAKDSKNNLVKTKRIIPCVIQDEERAENKEDSQEASSDGSSSQDVVSDDTSLEDAAEETPAPEPTGQALSEEEAAKEEQEALADAMPAGSPRIYLTDYVVHISAGTSVDRLSYVKEITDDTDDIFELYRKIQIEGDLNANIAGTYECKYYVIDSNGNQSNVALLKFIVE